MPHTLTAVKGIQEESTPTTIPEIISNYFTETALIPKPFTMKTFFCRTNHTPFSMRKIHQEPKHVKTSSLDILKLFVLNYDLSDCFLKSLYRGGSPIQGSSLYQLLLLYSIPSLFFFKVKHLHVTP